MGPQKYPRLAVQQTEKPTSQGNHLQSATKHMSPMAHITMVKSYPFSPYLYRNACLLWGRLFYDNVTLLLVFGAANKSDRTKNPFYLWFLCWVPARLPFFGIEMPKNKYKITEIEKGLPHYVSTLFKVHSTHTYIYTFIHTYVFEMNEWNKMYGEQFPF